MLANTPNFPAQIRATIFLHPLPHRFPQRFDIKCASPASIDQKIAMFVRYARGTNLQASTSGLVNFLPCFAAIRVGKSAAAGAHAAGCASPLLATISLIRDLIAAGSSVWPFNMAVVKIQSAGASLCR